MSLWKIAWRSIQQRGLASWLTTLSMALGVTMVVAVLLIHGIVTASFRNNSSLGYNMIVGPKGGKLQLVLNTVFYLSQPVENIPYEFYLNFLTADELQKLVDEGIHTPEEIDVVIEHRRALLTKREAREIGELSTADQRKRLMEGRFSRGTSDDPPKLAIPVLLGDYYKQYRVVGTTTALFDDLEYKPEDHKKYDIAQGRNFQLHSKEHGFFEAVVGATVAREYKLKLGDKLVASHGAAAGEASHEHGESPFTVVGILKPSGTPMDRAVFVNMEGFYLMSGHAKVVEEEDKLASETDAPATPDGETRPADPSEVHKAARRKLKMQPLALDEREVTAILYRIDDFAAMAYTNEINEGSVAQGVQPIAEIYMLLDMIVKPIQTLLLAITMLICVVSGVSILVSIYNSMNERKHEIAVMRALGAGRSTVMIIVLLESIFLSLGGGIIGWLLGHGAIFAARDYVEQLTGVSLGPFELAPASAEVLTMLFAVFAWLLMIGGSAMFVVSLLGFVWALVSRGGPRGSWQPARGWMMAAIFGIVLRFIGVAFYYLANEGAFVPLGELVPPELVLVPGLVLLAVLVGFLPAITAYRTDVAKSLQA